MARKRIPKRPMPLTTYHKTSIDGMFYALRQVGPAVSWHRFRDGFDTAWVKLKIDGEDTPPGCHGPVPPYDLPDAAQRADFPDNEPVKADLEMFGTKVVDEGPPELKVRAGYASVLDRVRKIRGEVPITDEVLAEQASLSPDQVTAILAGITPLTDDTLCALGNALAVGPSMLDAWRRNLRDELQKVERAKTMTVRRGSPADEWAQDRLKRATPLLAGMMADLYDARFQGDHRKRCDDAITFAISMADRLLDAAYVPPPIDPD